MPVYLPIFFFKTDKADSLKIALLDQTYPGVNALFVSPVLVRESIAQLNSVSRTVEVLRAEMYRLAGQLPEIGHQPVVSTSLPEESHCQKYGLYLLSVPKNPFERWHLDRNR